MERLGTMEVYDFEELLDEHFGKVGTPRRDRFEYEVDETLRAYNGDKPDK